MKKALVLVLLALILTGCPDPTGPTQVAVVKNSNWDTVMTAEVALSGSRAIDSESLEAQVAAYNEANTDDQQVIYYDEAPEVEEAPEADAFIVHPYTHEIYTTYLDVAREEVRDKRSDWAYDAYFLGRDTAKLFDDFGEVIPCTIYVDNVPPAPGVPVPMDPYEKYALYQVRISDDAILYEAHPAATEYRTLWQAYSIGVELHNRDNPDDLWKFVYGQLYPIVVPEDPEDPVE